MLGQPARGAFKVEVIERALPPTFLRSPVLPVEDSSLVIYLGRAVSVEIPFFFFFGSLSLKFVLTKSPFLLCRKII